MSTFSRKAGGLKFKRTREAFPISSLVLISAILAFGSLSANAGPNSRAKLALHVRPHTERADCDSSGVKTPNDIVTSAPAGGRNYDVYVIAIDVKEFKYCQFGISYLQTRKGGVDILSWNKCSKRDIQSIDFPDPWTGVAVMADSCVKPAEGLLVLGFFNVDAYGEGGRLSLIGDPRCGQAVFGDCAAGNDSAAALGYVDFVK